MKIVDAVNQFFVLCFVEQTGFRGFEIFITDKSPEPRIGTEVLGKNFVINPRDKSFYTLY